VVRAHHGWMRINGVIGQGTTVTITLPRRDVGAYNDGVAGNARP
jgi:signal transduction histidine kinase